MSRKLARTTFYGMAIFGNKMQYAQSFMFRIVDIILDLFAMGATISYAKSNNEDINADMFCRLASNRINNNFKKILLDAIITDMDKYKHAQKFVK
jgi:hypothetical protein